VPSMGWIRYWLRGRKILSERNLPRSYIEGFIKVYY